jgi:hypothetical protein
MPLAESRDDTEDGRVNIPAPVIEAMHSFIRSIRCEDGIFFATPTNRSAAIQVLSNLRQLLSNQPGCAALNLTLRF